MPEPIPPLAAVTIPPGRREDRSRPDAPLRPAQLGRAGDGLALRCLQAARRVGPILRRHWLFAAVLVVAVGLRIVVMIAYWPALELFTDSSDYLSLAHTLVPGIWHPSGYGLFLALLSPTGQLGVVVVAQHLMGIAMGLLVYRLVLRLGARRWLAALAAVPVLLDGYQLSLEQFITAETLTSLLLLGGLVVLFSREAVGARRGATVGLLLAAATLTRTSILPVLVVVGLYLLLRRGHRQALLTYCAVAVAMLGGYGGWYAVNHGRFGLDDWTGIYLYGRVAPFATCDYSLPASEARVCPARPVSQRTLNGEFYSDDHTSPLWAAPGLGSRHQRNALGERFAITVIEHQPLNYLSAVLADMWHYFTPGRWMTTDRIDMQRWKFPSPHIHPMRDNYHVFFANEGLNQHRITPSPDPALMGPLRTYQSIFYTPGPLFLACVIGSLAVGLGLVRGRSRRRQTRWACLVLAASAVVLLLSPSLIWGFSYRYEIPLLVLCPPAGALAADLGLDAVRRRLGGRGRVGAGQREDQLGRSTAASTPPSDRTAPTTAAANPSEAR